MFLWGPFWDNILASSWDSFWDNILASSLVLLLQDSTFLFFQSLHY